MTGTITNNAAETHKLGEAFAAILHAGDTVALSGELGSGKTVFVQGALTGLGYRGSVTSPTFTLIHVYPAVMTVYHFDCFRLRKPADILTSGIEDYLDIDGILFVEWADLIRDYFKQWFWEVSFNFLNDAENKRLIRFSPGAGMDAPDRLTELEAMATGFSEIAP